MEILKRVLVMVCVLSVFNGCKSKKEGSDEDCVDPPNASVTKEATAASADGKSAPQNKVVMSDKDVNWCRACVMGPHGFMSCQRVSQSTTTETMEQLRDRARIAACKDSGFTETNCPPDKVISVACKGDPPPKDKRAAGEALLKALKTSGPLVLTKDGAKLEKREKRAAAASDNTPQSEKAGPEGTPEKAEK
jgi:hypothetical protein